MAKKNRGINLRCASNAAGLDKLKTEARDNSVTDRQAPVDLHSARTGYAPPAG